MTDQLDHKEHEPSLHRTVPLGGNRWCYRPTDRHIEFEKHDDGTATYNGVEYRDVVHALDAIDADETEHETGTAVRPPIAGRISAGRGPTPVYDDLMRSVFGR